MYDEKFTLDRYLSVVPPSDLRGKDLGLNRIHLMDSVPWKNAIEKWNRWINSFRYSSDTLSFRVTRYKNKKSKKSKRYGKKHDMLDDYFFLIGDLEISVTDFLYDMHTSGDLQVFTDTFDYRDPWSSHSFKASLYFDEQRLVMVTPRSIVAEVNISYIASSFELILSKTYLEEQGINVFKEVIYPVLSRFSDFPPEKIF